MLSILGRKNATFKNLCNYIENLKNSSTKMKLNPKRRGKLWKRKQAHQFSQSKNKMQKKKKKKESIQRWRNIHPRRHGAARAQHLGISHTTQQNRVPPRITQLQTHYQTNPTIVKSPFPSSLSVSLLPTLTFPFIYTPFPSPACA